MPKEKDAKAVELLGSPHKLISLVVTGAGQKEKVLQTITQGGPPHKQLQHTLVLKRLEKLAGLLKKRNGLSLKHINGKEIQLENDDETLPVQIPARSLEHVINVDKVFEKLTKGPGHEILYTALLLQIIEGMIIAEEEAK